MVLFFIFHSSSVVATLVDKLAHIHTYIVQSPFDTTRRLDFTIPIVNFDMIMSYIYLKQLQQEEGTGPRNAKCPINAFKVTSIRVDIIN